MPPKKAGGKKPATIIIDGVDTSEMTREKLEQFTLKVKEELDKEREERNYFQLERDKIRTFWEISRTQLEECKAELRNKERAAEEVQEENEALLETEKQKIKHLKYEHQAALAALRAENLVALKAAKEDHSEQELELLNDKRALRQEMKEKLLAAQDELRRAKLVHAEELSKVRADFDEKARQIEEKAEKKLNETKIELGVKHRTEIAEVEERKNKQLSELIADHDKAFAELKNYYNDITLNNLGLINSLKHQMEEMQKARERAEKTARDAGAEARALRGPLQTAVLENKELKRQMSNYDRDKATLNSKTKQVSVLEKQLEMLKWEHEVLQVRFDRVQAERDELKARLTKAVIEVQQRASLKTALLEAKLKNMEGRDLGPKDLHELLKFKDNQLEDMKYEVARLRKAHDDLLATYEAKLAKLGVSPDELGFKQIRDLRSLVRLGRKLNETKIELGVKNRTEIAEVEERKNKQLSELIADHDEAFAELKNYYNDITLNNLGLINSLKHQMEEMLKARERAEKTARDAGAEARALQTAVLENKELKRQMSNYDRDKATLNSKTKQVSVLEKQLEMLKWEHEVLQVRFDRVQAERDELKARFTKAVIEVQQRASMRTALLEAKLKNMEGRDLGPKDLHALEIRSNQQYDHRTRTSRPGYQGPYLNYTI